MKKTEKKNYKPEHRLWTWSWSCNEIIFYEFFFSNLFYYCIESEVKRESGHFQYKLDNIITKKKGKRIVLIWICRIWGIKIGKFVKEREGPWEMRNLVKSHSYEITF